MGVERAGFRHLAVNEVDSVACETLRGHPRVWPVIEEDSRKVDWALYEGKVDLLAGGAPCQPFSFGGRHRGDADARNMFPEVFRAIAESAPRAVLLENVTGLARESFRPYLAYVLARLAHPDAAPRDGESWAEHATRLVARPPSDARYSVYGPVALNAADFGVPQTRLRLFVVAFRSDEDHHWEWPAATHSRDALIREQVSGTYWEQRGIPRRRVKYGGGTGRVALEREPDSLKAWVTVRDALAGLGAPAPSSASARVLRGCWVRSIGVWPQCFAVLFLPRSPMMSMTPLWTRRGVS